ncbi:MAG TPA: AIR carboxylase family protein [Longimicrobiaceae bacterium]
MTPERLRALLRGVAEGRIAPAEAERTLAWAPMEDASFATVDHHRALRQGFPEVVFGAGKTPGQTAEIARRIAARGEGVLVTRVSAEAAEMLAAELPGIELNELGRTAWLAPDEPLARRVRGPVLVVTAGTSDLPVGEEAVATARAFGNPVERLTDVGVAGREGALPSVVGGLVSVPVIAVPTSVGYGAAFGGLAALLGMLNSCASGVTVVNIDNGFGAAAAASRINLLPPD